MMRWNAYFLFQIAEAELCNELKKFSLNNKLDSNVFQSSLWDNVLDLPLYHAAIPYILQTVTFALDLRIWEGTFQYKQRTSALFEQKQADIIISNGPTDVQGYFEDRSS